MKKKVLPFFTIWCILMISTVIHAQQPLRYPKYNPEALIPFGNRLPAPDGLTTLLKSSLTIAEQKLEPTDQGLLARQVLHSEKPYYFRNENHDKHEGGLKDNSLFHLTMDVNTSTPSSNPHNYGFAYRPSYAVLDQVAYFNADDGEHGYELWRTDGTAKGTYMVKDILEGKQGGSATSIISAKGKIFFSAYTNETGWAPWVSDGSKQGTHLLMKIPDTIYHTYAEQFVKVGNTVFFTTNSDHGNALWKTDGTEEGTTLVYNFNTYFEWAGYINQAMSAGSLLFFTAWTPIHGRELWRSDGTTQGTFMVKDLGPDQGDWYAPMQLTAFNHKLYFSGNDGSGRTLWCSDGTALGTYPVVNPTNVLVQNDFLNYWENVPFAVLNHSLYFAGLTYASGSGLYKVDASPYQQVELVKDLWPGWEYMIIVPTELKAAGNKLFFKVISSLGSYHDELWSSGGTAMDTKIVRSFQSGQVTTVYSSLKGQLYFVEDEPSTGPELWTSNGTFSGTHLVKDIYHGSQGSYPYFMTALGDQLVFSANEPQHGAELWVSDGTQNATHPVRDINDAFTYGSNPGSERRSMAALQDGIFLFGASDPLKGNELYRTDGSREGSFLLKDILPGETGSYPNDFMKTKRAVYFRANNNNLSLGFPGSTIWKTDGTKKGTVPVVEINNAYYLGFAAGENGIVFFAQFNLYTYSYELWRTDGTPSGTQLLTANLFYNPIIVMMRNKAFFVAGDYEHGFELWSSDGTVAGTKMVYDINPGYNGSYAYSLYAWKGSLYFGAYDGNYFHYSFWMTDGTEVGTHKLGNQTPAYFDYSTEGNLFAGMGHLLFLSAVDYTAFPYEGGQLWRTDGTVGGTKIVKRINPYFEANPSHLTPVEEQLYLTADDGVHGVEVWMTNGTEQGTKMMEEIVPGTDKLFASDFCSIGEVLFFLKDAGTDAASIWKLAHKGQFKQLEAIAPLYNLQHLMAAEQFLFLTANSEAYGTELYAAEMKEGYHKVPDMEEEANSNTIAAITPEVVRFSAQLITNPVKGDGQLLLQGVEAATVIKVTDAQGALLWQYRYAGNSLVRLPSENWAAGIYLVTVQSGREKKIIQMIKQ